MRLLDRRTQLLTVSGLTGSGTDEQTLSQIGLTVVRDRGSAFAERPRRLVVSDEIFTDASVGDQLAHLSLSGLRLLRLHDYYERTQRCVLLDNLSEAWFSLDQPLRQRRSYLAVKTLTDIVAGVLGSIVVLLAMPFIWLAILLDDGGPMIFRQERIGLRGRPFMIVKFRTMRVDAETTGPVWASQADDRVTRVGRVLRQLRIDELPQFFNILRGEMSLIGPRPERAKFVGMLARTVPFYERRHLTKPGVTGWATVRFGYGSSITDKWRSHGYDLYYLKHRSVLLDLEILLRTAWVIVSRRGQ